MRRLEEYVSADGTLLRCGYTTGTCAAAAARAATRLLLTSDAPSAMCIRTPAGIDVVVDVEESACNEAEARCAVRKDAGDDPDVTDGALVFARVSRGSSHGVDIDGGEGVGRVTKPGLDQPVGAAAINSTPRAMICDAALNEARSCGYAGGLRIVIEVPDGKKMAERTFNPRLGIVGGISILGTSGIVRPMSEQALVSSIQLELRVLREAGKRDVLVVPGNYGRSYAADVMGLSLGDALMCSNYVGQTIDEAGRLGFSSLLLVGHIGKMCKVAGGIMNTHSRVADCRAEIMCTHAALVGASHETLRRILEVPTTDAALACLDEQGLMQDAMASLIERLGVRLRERAAGHVRVEAVVFSNRFGLLGMTSGAKELCVLHRQEGEAP